MIFTPKELNLWKQFCEDNSLTYFECGTRSTSLHLKAVDRDGIIYNLSSKGFVSKYKPNDAVTGKKCYRFYINPRRFVNKTKHLKSGEQIQVTVENVLPYPSFDICLSKLRRHLIKVANTKKIKINNI